MDWAGVPNVVTKTGHILGKLAYVSGFETLLFEAGGKATLRAAGASDFLVPGPCDVLIPTYKSSLIYEMPTARAMYC
eukprot:scaffold11988_cov164-Skeletonema_marinoi.AAC.2